MLFILTSQFSFLWFCHVLFSLSCFILLCLLFCIFLFFIFIWFLTVMVPVCHVFSLLLMEGLGSWPWRPFTNFQCPMSGIGGVPGSVLQLGSSHLHWPHHDHQILHGVPLQPFDPGPPQAHPDLYHDTHRDNETLRHLFWSGMDDILSQMLWLGEDQCPFGEFVDCL